LYDQGWEHTVRGFPFIEDQGRANTSYQCRGIVVYEY
jgi:hypothetical protein